MPPRRTAPKISPQKKLLINADHPEECRAVVLNDGKIEEIIIERASRELVKGNVYLGVITRVEPAIEAAFIDFGGKKFGFLPFKDVLKESYLKTGEKKAKIRIQDVLVRGQKILVQVVKESRDAKGPSMTNAVTIPGRFLVLMHGSPSTGVSRKIEDEAERRKLKEILADLELPENMGVIIRTAGVGRTKLELQKDLQMLLKLWETIQARLDDEESEAPIMLYEGPDMVVRTVRDHFSADTSEILLDNQDSYKAVKEFMKTVMPRMRNRVKHYQDVKPLFTAFKVEDQIENIYQRKVLLPSGGSIVFDMGEAMVCVDVNSGKTTSASELEETAVRTNLEAAEEVARQLRLRDLGGLVVIDFIDMFQKKNKALVEKQLKAACKVDKARVNISRISRFGLMEMSRQRMSPPLKEGVFDTCNICSGTGTIRANSHMALTVLRRIQESLAEGGVKAMQVEISQDVANYLLNNKTRYLMELQEKHNFKVEFVTQPHLAAENFEYRVVDRKRDLERPRESPREASREGAKESQKEPRREPRDRDRRRSSGRRPSARGPAKDKDKDNEVEVSSQVPETESTESTEETSAQTRGRKPANGDGRRRTSRRSTAKKSGPQRGRRWRSQRVKDKEGETSSNAGPLDAISHLPSGLSGPTLPLAGGSGKPGVTEQPEGSSNPAENSPKDPPPPLKGTLRFSPGEDNPPLPD